MKGYVDSCFKKLDSQLQKYEKENSEENEKINSNLQSMREFIDVKIK